jgi:hypothetical protein
VTVAKFKIESVHITVRRGADGITFVGACTCGARSSSCIATDIVEDSSRGLQLFVGAAYATVSMTRRKCRCWQYSVSSVQTAFELARMAAMRMR